MLRVCGWEFAGFTQSESPSSPPVAHLISLQRKYQKKNDAVIDKNFKNSNWEASKKLSRVKSSFGKSKLGSEISFAMETTVPF